jgi:hypothetical protein
MFRTGNQFLQLLLYHLGQEMIFPGVLAGVLHFLSDGKQLLNDLCTKLFLVQFLV